MWFWSGIGGGIEFAIDDGWNKDAGLMNWNGLEPRSAVWWKRSM